MKARQSIDGYELPLHGEQLLGVWENKRFLLGSNWLMTRGPLLQEWRPRNSIPGPKWLLES
jgi:hypothetical protein